MNHGVLALIVVAITSLCVQFTSCMSQEPKTILISFDGFRHDLLNASFTPNIYKWANKAAWFVNGLRSQYVTYTAPNHMGIATGLFQESHGIVSNFFFDPFTGKSFDYFNGTHQPGVVNASLDPSWYNGEPIWLTNERGGGSRRSSAFHWPNSEVYYNVPPHRPSFYRAWTTYRNYSELVSDVDEIVDMLSRKTDPYNFVAWYVAEPDHTLHLNGFYNGALRKKLTELDQLFSYFISKLDETGVLDHLNIIFTADHGHSEIKDYKHVMCIKDYITTTSFKIADHMIYTDNDEHTDEVYNQLKNAVEKHGFDIRIHKKKDFLDIYHYKNNVRVGDIILEPAVGSALSFSCTSEQMEKDYGPGGRKFNSSTHGMDPDDSEMRAVLVASGPAFVKEKKIGGIPQNIDLYPLICQLLKVSAAPNNGTMSIVRLALIEVDEVQDRKIQYRAVADNISFAIFIVPPTILVLLFLVYGCKHTIMKDDPAWALKVGGYRPLDTETGENIPMGPTGSSRMDRSREHSLLKALESSDEEI